jgi:hypothetical protein
MNFSGIWRESDYVVHLNQTRQSTCAVCNLGMGLFFFCHSKGGNTGVYPKVPGLAALSENCKWYSSLPLGAVVSLFCESV